MALASGTRFGPYEIGDPIGAGGMGEVYRATDTNLKRDVAIKVLPESLAADENRLARFQREAEVLASLNHPNIAQIFGLEKSDGTTALVMELIEGPTLADRIADGSLPADEALGIAMQIADALEAAHGQNIVHRDLKPANIKLKPDGTVKVLDFGIAKALDIRTLSGPEAPALTTPAMTQAGIILGTAAYMSPEQARGKQVDQRADIWAFGCLLYEMLTGQPAFAGEDIAITLARILTNNTDLKSLPAAVSPAVRQTIELCLQKDARKRIADIRDVKLALAGVFDTISVRGTGAIAVALPLWRRALPVLAAVLVTGVIVGYAVWRSTQPEPGPVNRFTYSLPEGQGFRGLCCRVMAISPNGRDLVYNTPQGLYLRAMGELEARVIPGTEPGLVSPSFSPDGRSVAYQEVQGQLKRISISGGAPVVIAALSGNTFGMSWEVDGTILVGRDDGIYRVSANGGTPERVIAVVDSATPFGPSLLPDGDTVLFTLTDSPDWDMSQIVAQSLTTGERTVIIEGGSDARYLPTGHLVFALGNGLFAVAFDPESLTVAGGVVPLVQGVMRATQGTTGAADYSISDDGILAYVAGSNAVAARRLLVWVDREGREQAINAPPRNYFYPRISPDGTKVALDVRDQELDIWTWDFARETLTRLTFDPANERFAAWSPDNRSIAFSTTRDSGNGQVLSIYRKAADGAGAAERLIEGKTQLFPVSFTPDGTAILVSGALKGGAADDDIAMFTLNGEEALTPLLQTLFVERNPEVSPDGHWLAYSSDESGREEVYVRPFPDIDTGRWQVSTAGGEQPLWAHDGQELFYRSGEGLFAVPIQTEPTFLAGNPELLFEGDYISANGRGYDVSADGERFLMIRQIDAGQSSAQIVIVQNWFEELKRLVPRE